MKKFLPLLVLSVCIAAPSFAADAQCRVKFVSSASDRTNSKLSAKLVKSDENADVYAVTDEEIPDGTYLVTITNKDGMVRVPGAGVPETTKKQLLERFENVNSALKQNKNQSFYDGFLTWSYIDEDASCSDVELSLIQFMVLEWFYFG